MNTRHAPTTGSCGPDPHGNPGSKGLHANPQRRSSPCFEVKGQNPPFRNLGDNGSEGSAGVAMSLGGKHCHNRCRWRGLGSPPETSVNNHLPQQKLRHFKLISKHLWHKDFLIAKAIRAPAIHFHREPIRETVICHVPRQPSENIFSTRQLRYDLPLTNCSIRFSKEVPGIHNMSMIRSASGTCRSWL